MDEEKSLLRAIALFPEEDTPRLMYADWLEENNKPDDAEFIRVQCELARMSTECHKFFCDGQLVICDECKIWKKHRKRQQQLFNQTYKSLSRRLPPNGERILLPYPAPELAGSLQLGCGTYRYGFSRGFATRVLLPLSEFMSKAVITPLFELNPIRSVIIENSEPYPVNQVTDKPFVDELSEYYFWRVTNFPVSFLSRHDVPNDLFSLLPRKNRVFIEGEDHLAFYPSRERALEALSESCVKYGRSIVGFE